MTQTVDRVVPGSDIPLVLPEVSDHFLPSASEYWEFRKKYPRLAGGQTARPTAAAVAPTIPFIAAAHEHAETFPVVSRVYTAGAGQETVEFNIPSYGYLRAIWLDINMPAQTGVAAEELAIGDNPFTAVTNITLLDTNGAPIYGPLTGYNAFLSNLYGGYVYRQDPREEPSFNAFATSGAFRYQLRIPIEISHHDATGCIGNQNAAAPYRLRLTLASVAEIWKKEPTTLANAFKITPILEAWSLPNAADALGRPQAQLPPNYGTVQYWSERTVGGIVAGNNNVQVLRVGNLIRNLLFIGRKTSASGERSFKVLPEFPIINWDARQLVNETEMYRRNLSYEGLEIGSATAAGEALKAVAPTGVFAYTFSKTNQSRFGDDKPWLWLPTVEATRLELTGSWPEGGVNQILVNDIAPAEVNPTQRYAVPSATGFHPSAEVPNPNQP